MLYLIGNSHIRFAFKEYYKIQENIMLSIDGATIFGLLKENANNLINEIKKYNYTRDDTVIINMGQTDLEYVYYYRSVINNEKLDMNNFMTDIIKIYKFIINKHFNNTNVIIMGIDPPRTNNMEYNFRMSFKKKDQTSKNAGYQDDEVRKIVFRHVAHVYNDSHEDRIKIHRQFNNILKMVCDEFNCKYFDLWDLFVINNVLNNKYAVITNNIKLMDHHVKISDYNEFNNYLYNKINN